VGSRAGLTAAYLALGQALQCSGQLEGARDALEYGVAAGQALRSQLLSALAEVYAALGDHERARETATDAVRIARETGQFELPPELARARVLRCADGLAAEEAIRAALDRALELIEASGARVYRPEVHEEHAELARLRGDEAARTRELRDAHRLYTEMGATGHAERLARELGAPHSI
jgi:tetratricopeptide (TPR) repeat protein